MRFALVDQAKKDFPVHRLCQVLGVSQSGYFAWKDRPASRRQRDDLVMLAHVRSAFALSNGTYGSPRMARELRDDGFAIGRRRTARLMRENGLRGRQKRRFKRTTDSEHSWPIALRPGFYGDYAQPEMGRGHLVCLDAGGMALSGGGHRPFLPPRDRLGCRRPPAPRSGAGRAAQGPRHAASAPPLKAPASTGFARAVVWLKSVQVRGRARARRPGPPKRRAALRSSRRRRG